MKKQNEKILILALFGTIILLSLIIVLLIPNVIDHFNYTTALKKGYETQGIIQEFEIDNATYNETQYARAIFTYTNSEGEEKQGTTSLCYSAHDSLPQVGSSILIMVYNDITVESSYTMTAPYIVSIVLCSIFALITLALLIIILIVIALLIRSANIIKNGRKMQATFLSYNMSSVRINYTEMYYVTFTFQGAYNQVKTVKSSPKFTLKEVEILQALHEFEIYALEDTAVITQSFDNLELEEIKAKSGKPLFCENCGAQNERSAESCFNCARALHQKKEHDMFEKTYD